MHLLDKIKRLRKRSDDRIRHVWVDVADANTGKIVVDPWRLCEGGMPQNVLRDRKYGDFDYVTCTLCREMCRERGLIR